MSQSKFRSKLSWLGVVAVIAGCAVAALVQAPRLAYAQVTHVQTTVCRGAASGQVATSSRGQGEGWAQAALNTLCANTETSPGPGECFAFVMGGNVNYGGGTAWQPNNALRLCAGATDSGRRVQCFQRKVGEGTGWSAAIDECIAEERTVQAGARTIVNAPLASAPLARPLTEGDIAAARNQASSNNANMICEGPLLVSAEGVLSGDVRGGTVIRATFTAATSANVQPGQCWREGGWASGALMRTTTGTVEFVSRQGPCAAIPILRFRDGMVTELTAIDSPATDLLNLGRRGLGEVTIVTRYAGADTSGADTPSLFIAQPSAAQRPPLCR